MLVFSGSTLFNIAIISFFVGLVLFLLTRVKLFLALPIFVMVIIAAYELFGFLMSFNY